MLKDEGGELEEGVVANALLADVERSNKDVFFKTARMDDDLIKMNALRTISIGLFYLYLSTS